MCLCDNCQLITFLTTVVKRSFNNSVEFAILTNVVYYKNKIAFFIFLLYIFIDKELVLEINVKYFKINNNNKNAASLHYGAEKVLSERATGWLKYEGSERLICSGISSCTNSFVVYCSEVFTIVLGTWLLER